MENMIKKYVELIFSQSYLTELKKDPKSNIPFVYPFSVLYLDFDLVYPRVYGIPG